MYYKPKKQPKKAGISSVLLYGAAALLYVTGEFISPRLVYQAAALVCVAVALFITGRYLLTDYKYVLKDIDQRGAEVTFSIIKINGQREVAMANFKMLSAFALEKCKRLATFEAIHGKADKYYNYCTNLSSDDAYKLGIDFNGMKVVFSIELSDEMAQRIRDCIPCKDVNEDKAQ